MAKQKFTDVELKQLVRRGYKCSEIARRFGVTRAAVSMRLKALNVAVSKDVTLRSAGEIVRKELDTVEQLQKINRCANEILDLLMESIRGDGEALQALRCEAQRAGAEGGKSDIPTRQPDFLYRIPDIGNLSKDPRELALKVMQEIRGQLRLQFEIFKAISDMKAVQEFQSEVLQVMGEVSPDARDEIVRRLSEKNAIRSNLDLN